jgi:hypothetical protein
MSFLKEASRSKIALASPPTPNVLPEIQEMVP